MDRKRSAFKTAADGETARFVLIHSGAVCIALCEALNAVCCLPSNTCDINPFSPRLAKTGHFVILLCLTQDNITR